MNVEINKPLNVLLVAPVPPPIGGISHQINLLVKHIPHYPEVAVALVNTAARWQKSLQMGYLTRIFGGIFNAIRIKREVFRKCTNGSVDVVHLTTTGGLSFARDLFLISSLGRRDLPTVLSVHMGRLPDVLSASTIERFIARVAFRKATVVLVLDEKSEQALKSIEPKTWVKKRPNFVDPEALNRVHPDRGSIESNKCDVVFVGWVLPTKGVVELVKACVAVPNVRLKIVGPVESGFAEDLLRLGKGTTGSVKLTNELSAGDVYRVIADSRALALPSYSEGFPNVVLEAMALGTPVIATPVGAIPEILQLDTVMACGRSVKVGDIQSLVVQIEDLLNNPNDWDEMGRRGKERVERLYTAKVVIPQLITVWQTAALARLRNRKPKGSQSSSRIPTG